MEYIIRYILSSIKKVNISTEDPLPKDITDLLLMNFSGFYIWITSYIDILFLVFTNIELLKCDFSTTKILLESRKFDYIGIHSDIFEKVKDIHTTTKDMRFFLVPFTEVVRLDSVKTTSLYISQQGDNFNENIFNVDIKYVLF